MEKRYWFLAKSHGWGWYPATWQGWSATAFYLLLVFAFAWKILGGSAGGIAGIRQFLMSVLILSGLFLYVCYAHGEPPRWRWGEGGDTHDPNETHP